MAKLAYSKLKLKAPIDVSNIEFEANGEILNIEVKKYLPLDEKIKLLERVINAAQDDMHFYNTIKLEMFLLLEILQAYTNLSFTDKILENPTKLYDELSSSSLVKDILLVLNEYDEYRWLHSKMTELVQSIYNYNNSILGIMSNITNDFDGAKDQLAELQEQLGNSENVQFVRDILTKLK